MYERHYPVREGHDRATRAAERRARREHSGVEKLDSDGREADGEGESARAEKCGKDSQAVDGLHSGHHVEEGGGKKKTPLSQQGINAKLNVKRSGQENTNMAENLSPSKPDDSFNHLDHQPVPQGLEGREGVQPNCSKREKKRRLRCEAAACLQGLVKSVMENGIDGAYYRLPRFSQEYSGGTEQQTAGPSAFHSAVTSGLVKTGLPFVQKGKAKPVVRHLEEDRENMLSDMGRERAQVSIKYRKLDAGYMHENIEAFKRFIGQEEEGQMVLSKSIINALCRNLFANVSRSQLNIYPELAFFVRAEALGLSEEEFETFLRARSSRENRYCCTLCFSKTLETFDEMLPWITPIKRNMDNFELDFGTYASTRFHNPRIDGMRDHLKDCHPNMFYLFKHFCVMMETKRGNMLVRYLQEQSEEYTV